MVRREAAVVANILSLLLLLAVPGAADSASGEVIPPADSTARAPRVVKQFPAVEVRALLHDLRSSQTVHELAGPALRAYPVDDLAELVALQPGVVAQGEALHVRGGRAGETLVNLNGLTLNEPLRFRAMELPLLALRSVELVSGAPESRFGGALAGVLDLHTIDPGDRLSGEWRWQSDGGLDTRFDRASARIGAPIGWMGLGVAAAADVTLDDTWLPALRSQGRHRVAGLSLGWRAENRVLGYFKLAPVAAPQRFSAQVMVSRQVHQPYDPAWSLEGWVGPGPSPSSPPVFSPVPQAGFVRYRAADHLAMTDDRQLGALVSISTLRGSHHAALGLGWLRTRTVTSVGGVRGNGATIGGQVYGSDASGDAFHVLWGDYPLYRESGSDVYTLRGDAEWATAGGSGIKAGAGLTYQDVSMDEVDLQFPGAPFDVVRAYRASAPGGFAYGQGRWQTGGMVLNGGLRAEYFTAGPRAGEQTLPGSTGGRVSLSPRLGIAYPLTVRDVFSLAYARMQQAPGRDFLYDQRVAITNRQPLGDPALEPATMISYEAAVKHLMGPAWALQSSLFYRDIARQVGARDSLVPYGPVDLRYTNEDQASAAGFEISLIHADGDDRRVEVHYTWMQAWGYESRAEGDPYGPVRDIRAPPLGETPLSWDRRHSILVSGAWRWRDRWSVAWSSAVGSPLPWTPKARREGVTDLTVVNSRRFQWTETTNLKLAWSPRHLLGLTLGLEALNLFGTRGERAATLDGYPNPVINTLFDDYGAYRTETGLPGGAYWTNGGSGSPRWVPVHDERLLNPPRILRASVGARW
jgi:outer membrane receptor protein involved in Fe transport